MYIDFVIVNIKNIIHVLIFAIKNMSLFVPEEKDDIIYPLKEI